MCKYELIDAKTKKVITVYNKQDLYIVIKENTTKDKTFDYYIICYYPNYKTGSIESQVFSCCMEVYNKQLGKKEIVLMK